MSIWNITNIRRLAEHNGQSDVAFVVEYTVRKAAGKKPWSSTYALNIENLDAFIPYASLTEAQIIQWVKDGLGSSMVQDIENVLSDDPELINGTPWG